MNEPLEFEDWLEEFANQQIARMNHITLGFVAGCLIGAVGLVLWAWAVTCA